VPCAERLDASRTSCQAASASDGDRDALACSGPAGRRQTDHRARHHRQHDFWTCSTNCGATAAWRCC
jgi:hypothetical protein